MQGKYKQEVRYEVKISWRPKRIYLLASCSVSKR